MKMLNRWSDRQPEVQAKDLEKFTYTGKLVTLKDPKGAFRVTGYGHGQDPSQQISLFDSEVDRYWSERISEKKDLIRFHNELNEKFILNRHNNPDPIAPWSAAGLYLSIGYKGSTGGASLEIESLGLKSNGTMSVFGEIQSNTFDAASMGTSGVTIFEGGLLFVFDDGIIDKIIDAKTGVQFKHEVEQENLFRVDIGSGINLMIEYNNTAKELKVGVSFGKPGVSGTHQLKGEAFRATKRNKK